MIFYKTFTRHFITFAHANFNISLLMFYLPKDRIAFPPVEKASNEGLLAIGGDLSIERIVHAYQNGIFPWYTTNDDILWWSPNPRMILFPKEVKISKSMQRLIKKGTYTITENQAFDEVINNCATVHKAGKDEAWLHHDMITAYKELFKAGLAHSVEVWNKEGELVGGLYGVKINKHIYSGESMFHKESNTSKLAFIHLAQMAAENNIEMIDCQMHTPHLESLGAREIPRASFMRFLKE